MVIFVTVNKCGSRWAPWILCSRYFTKNLKIRWLNEFSQFKQKLNGIKSSRFWHLKHLNCERSGRNDTVSIDMPVECWIWRDKRGGDDVSLHLLFISLFKPLHRWFMFKKHTDQYKQQNGNKELQTSSRKTMKVLNYSVAPLHPNDYLMCKTLLENAVSLTIIILHDTL